MRVAAEPSPVAPSRPALVDSVEVRARLRAVIARHGAVGAAKRLGMPKDSLLACAADAPVRAGTILVASNCLDQYEAKQRGASEP